MGWFWPKGSKHVHSSVTVSSISFRKSSARLVNMLSPSTLSNLAFSIVPNKYAQKFKAKNKIRIFVEHPKIETNADSQQVILHALTATRYLRQYTWWYLLKIEKKEVIDLHNVLSCEVVIWTIVIREYNWGDKVVMMFSVILHSSCDGWKLCVVLVEPEWN